MKTSLMCFAVITIVYTLMTAACAWFGFEYDRPDMVDVAGGIHAFGWMLSYISLAIFLLIDSVYWILKK